MFSQTKNLKKKKELSNKNMPPITPVISKVIKPSKDIGIQYEWPIKKKGISNSSIK